MGHLLSESGKICSPIQPLKFMVLMMMDALYSKRVDSNYSNSRSRGPAYGFVYPSAIVLPAGTDPDVGRPFIHQFWVVKIRDIRSRQDSSGEDDVWIRVQWYYSPKDVAGVIKSFDASKCGRYERIFSDHYDTLSSTTFSDNTMVKRYIENDIEQEDINANWKDNHPEFYCRYDLECLSRTLSPKHRGTCLCGEPYNPDQDVMHFCPRPSCRKAYHRDCLAENNCVETSPRGREDRLLASSPDSDEPFPLASYQASPGKRKRGGGKGKEAVRSSPLDALPEELLRVARLPITKGVRAGGLVGNVRSVVTARRLVYAALENHGILPEDWEDQIVSKALKDTVLPETTDIPPLRCPGCQGAI